MWAGGKELGVGRRKHENTQFCDVGGGRGIVNLITKIRTAAETRILYGAEESLSQKNVIELKRRKIQAASHEKID